MTCITNHQFQIPNATPHSLASTLLRPYYTARTVPFRNRQRRKVLSQARTDNSGWFASVKSVTETVAKTGLILAATTTIAVAGAFARLEGVNKPELLPNEYTPVIDVAGFLTPGEVKRIRMEVENLERDTGVKLRVLAQNYPSTPGLAIKDFWGVDDDTVVFVADPNTGNILNFNVGRNVDLLVPRSFWSRLAGRYGNKFYWQDNGQEAAIVNAVSAIDTCLREPPGRLQCSKVQGEFGEEPSSGPLGKKMFGS